MYTDKLMIIYLDLDLNDLKGPNGPQGQNGPNENYPNENK
jgi:hypothetical protein